MSTIQLKDYYSFDQYAAYRAVVDELAKLNAAGTPDDGRKLLAQIDLIHDRFMEMVKAKFAAGDLAEVDYCEHRQLPWAMAWNDLARTNISTKTTGTGTQSDGESGWLKSLQERMFHRTLLMLTSLSKAGGTSVDAGYADLCKMINSGKFDIYLPAAQVCDRTGVAYEISFENWKPYLYTRVKDADGKIVRLPLTEQIGPLEAQQAQISAPSGKLWVADWIRIEEFTDVVSPKESRWSNSVNYLFGRLAYTHDMARNHNVLSVHVGNSCPAVLQDGDLLAIATGTNRNADYDPNSLSSKDIGTVCTDLWAATIVDEEVLFGILSRSMGEEGARAAMSKYLQENDVLIVNVPAGSTIYASFMDEGMPDVTCDRISKKGIGTLYMAASTSAPLVWKPSQTEVNQTEIAARPKSRC